MDCRQCNYYLCRTGEQCRSSEHAWSRQASALSCHVAPACTLMCLVLFFSSQWQSASVCACASLRLCLQLNSLTLSAGYKCKYTPLHHTHTQLVLYCSIPYCTHYVVVCCNELYYLALAYTLLYPLIPLYIILCYLRSSWILFVHITLYCITYRIFYNTI